MLYHAKNGTVHVGDTDMNYVSFGKGKDIFVMLPGLGDGISTVKGMAAILAMTYRMYAKDYTVFIFSRKNDLPQGYSTRDMAKDQAEAMKNLGISHASIMGVSQGGMIAQYLAIDYPDLVDKLVLTVTLSKPNEGMQKIVNDWIAMAKCGNYRELMIDTAEKSYSKAYLKKYRFLYPLLGITARPRDSERFLIQGNSCLGHNAYPELKKIVCPVLILGGSDDKIVGANASVELAREIKNSELFIYEGLGHAAYEEAKDFNARVLKFLSK